MTIRQRLFFSFFIILALFALNAGINKRANARRSESLDSIQQAIHRQSLVRDIGGALEERRNAAANLALLAEAGTSLESTQVAHLGSLLDEIKESIADLGARSENRNLEKVSVLAERFDRLSAGWKNLYQQLERASEPDAPQGESRTPVDMNELEQIAEQTANILGQLEAAQDEAVQDASIRLREVAAFSDRVSFLLFIASSLVALAVALAFSSYLDRGLNTLAIGARRIGRGELEHRIALSGRDELADLALAFNTMASDLRRAQDRIDEAREAAEEASNAKSSFLANMSHELRTPLNVIIGYAEMLLEDAQEQEDQGAESDLERILSASRHLTALIDDILDLSKIEAAKMTLSVEPFDLAALLDDVTAAVEPLLSKNRNRLEKNIDPLIGTMVADKTKVQQILLNLLANACKFTRDGVISLRVARRSSDNGERVLLEVADSGIGIRAERLETIFDAFTQAESSTSTEYGGTGLGLALCKKLSVLMGGEIRVESKLNQGSIFFVELPAGMARAKTGEITMPTIASGTFSMPRQLETALLLGDPSTYPRVQERLIDSGLAVAMATSAGEAIAMAQKVRARAIVIDLLAHPAQGRKALADLLAEESCRQLPILALSLLDSPEAQLALGPVRLEPTDRLWRRLSSSAEYGRPSSSSPDIGDIDEPSSDERPGRLLLVSARRESIAPLTCGLEQRGWIVESTPGGEDNPPQVDSPPPDLLLLDLTVGDDATACFVAQARANPRWRQVPRVALVAEPESGSTVPSPMADLAWTASQGFETALDDLVRSLSPPGEDRGPETGAVARKAS